MQEAQEIISPCTSYQREDISCPLSSCSDQWGRCDCMSVVLVVLLVLAVLAVLVALTVLAVLAVLAALVRRHSQHKSCRSADSFRNNFSSSFLLFCQPHQERRYTLVGCCFFSSILFLYQFYKAYETC